MSKEQNIWIVDDDQSIRWVLEKALQQEKINIDSFSSGDEALLALGNQQPDAIISDIRMPGIDGLQLLEKIHAQHPNLPVIITTAHSDLDSAVNSYQSGAFEYLPKPFDIDEVLEVVQRALQQAAKNQKAPKKLEQANSTEIIGEAPAMQEVFRAIGRLSQSNITVLINGESGTGKELVAHALHKHSPRRDNAFIALNMAAIPKDLIESELFGHEKGAFTGANTLHKGKFEQANNGTLFLDEIGDMPAEAQTRLLRVLADGEFYRVGGHTPVKVDVRIIAATHQNLEALVTEKTFREDLFHRLNVIRIHIPKLADRREDIAQLTQHFLLKAAKDLGVANKTITKEALEFLAKLPWPGNVRQLENTCRWLMVMASGQQIHINDLPEELSNTSQSLGAEQNQAQNSSWQDQLETWAKEQLQQGRKDILQNALPEFETSLIKCALAHTRGRKQEAAILLGWGRNTLTRKIKELEIESNG